MKTPSKFIFRRKPLCSSLDKLSIIIHYNKLIGPYMGKTNTLIGPSASKTNTFESMCLIKRIHYLTNGDW